MQLHLSTAEKFTAFDIVMFLLHLIISILTICVVDYIYSFVSLTPESTYVYITLILFYMFQSFVMMCKKMIM